MRNRLLPPRHSYQDFPEKIASPERNLLAAILARAIRDYLTMAMESKEHKSRARRWLCINRRLPLKPKLFSFSWICLQLELDPFLIREIIKAEAAKPAGQSQLVRILTDVPNSSYKKAI